MLEDACMEIIEKLRRGAINLEAEKCEIAKRHCAGKVPKNAEIFSFVGKDDPDYEILRRRLRIKPVRTLSGVANISVMWLGPENYSCPGKCIYCVQGNNSPKSYTGCEPTTMRAIRNDYDAKKQVTNRLKQLHIIGHSTGKCELIIMGGTFMSMPAEFQSAFVKGCLDALNLRESASLEEAQTINETAANRCVGLTIETRADYCSAEKMLALGATRVELGVQSTSDRILEAIGRGHGTGENIRAIKLVKDAGLKAAAHWMPGLTGLFGDIDVNEELRLFEQLFGEDYAPDELKIYPALVLPGTQLYELWKAGKYAPLSDEQMLELLIRMKQRVPEWVRIKRIMRDISEHAAAAGAATTNLRQLARIEMEQRGLRCRCIRCREAGFNNAQGEPELRTTRYNASGGEEIFISMEIGDVLYGFARLRLADRATLRELHVYGEATPVGSSAIMVQHRGFGKLLLGEAEARANGYDALLVTSGVGAREYYRHLGYELKKPYMSKKL